jgi:hypothetical protein
MKAYMISKGVKKFPVLYTPANNGNLSFGEIGTDIPFNWTQINKRGKFIGKDLLDTENNSQYGQDPTFSIPVAIPELPTELKKK